MLRCTTELVTGYFELKMLTSLRIPLIDMTIFGSFKEGKSDLVKDMYKERNFRNTLHDVLLPVHLWKISNKISFCKSGPYDIV